MKYESVLAILNLRKTTALDKTFRQIIISIHLCLVRSAEYKRDDVFFDERTNCSGYIKME